ncbi:diguanylate cyclase [Candidatus Poribacteria bacterium]|nr:diguanylate cyclase [Candidatus Poribacteria bacterium]
MNKQSKIHNSHPTRIHALLVEDNPDDADQLRKTLAEASPVQLKLTHVERLNEALKHLSEGGFDVILLDLFLPDSQGLDTLLRVYLQVPSVPIIVLMELDDEALVVKSIQKGALGYLVKGQLNDGTLRRAIHYATERHRIRMELQKYTRELKASEACFRHIIEKNVDGIVIVNQEGIIRFVNPAAEALFGRKAGELVGEMFGFPMTVGETTEIDIIRRHGGTAAAEMRLAEIEWEGERGYLASLRDITERKQMEMELERTRQREYHLAYHDTLTDLPNRQLFFDRLHQSVALARRHGQLVSVLFLDLDGFKFVNDTFGHRAGDLLLQLVAQRLSGCLRESDTVARLGGDEFTVILNNIAQAQDAATVAQKILKVLSKPFVVEGYQLVVTASIGISLYPYDGEDAETLARNADTAMYRAKGRGKNSYQFYNLLMTATDLERMALANSWWKGLKKVSLKSTTSLKFLSQRVK